MSRRNALPALFTLVSIGLILFTAWSLNHFRKYQPYAALLADSNIGPRQFALQLSDVELRGRSGGAPQWSVHARQIQLTPDQSNISIDSLEGGVLMRAAKPYLRFVAEHALYALGGTSPTSGIVQVSGGIHIDSIGPAAPFAAPIAIATARAVWDGYRSMLTLPDQVKLTFSQTASSPTIALDSQGASWNAVAHQLTCPRRVHATVGTLAGYGPYQIESIGLVYNEPVGQIRCENPISVSVPALGSVTCRPFALDTRQHSADFGMVHIIADAAAVDTVASSSSAASGAVKQATTPAADKSAADDNEVFIDAPEGMHWDYQNRVGTARGQVTFRQGDTSMSTVGITYDRKTDIATALSPITITDPESIVKGKAGTVDFKHHVATISGDIHIDVEPKADKNADADDAEARQPSTMTCDAIDYNYRKKFAVTKGTVVIKQTHRTVTSDRGTYDTVKKYAELTGNVIADSDDGQHMEADLAKISLKKGDEWIDIPKPKVMTIKVAPEDNPKSDK